MKSIFAPIDLEHLNWPQQKSELASVNLEVVHK